MKKPIDILNKYWGHDSFRVNQLEIIESILSQNDTLALLPTGGGKSICFQIPALLSNGICIVITPLIALMQDQVNVLGRKGIKALSIYSGMSSRDIDITLDNAVYGDYSFLYISPERLETALFKERFKKMNVSFIAVDEAHCISQWGYDFRPAYLKISELKKMKPDLTFLALTATATPAVIEDIQGQLEFNSCTFFKSSFERPNLKYITLNSGNKLDDIAILTAKLKGSGIIYCNTRKQTKNLFQLLENKGISSTFYHAGLDKDVRKERQEAWMTNRIRIIISTNAFGMGIDKPDVRFVLHYDTPDNIESYFQEAGRAGRDLNSSRAILLFDDSDIKKLKDKIALKYPELDLIKRIYTALGNHFQLATGSGKESIFNLNLSDFSAKYNLNLYSTYSALKILENSGFIKLNESTYTVSRLKILVDKIKLYDYQVRNIEHNKVIQFLLRSHLGIFEEYLDINESIIARKTGFTKSKIYEILNNLQQQQVVDYIAKNSGAQIVYLTERLSDQNFSIPKEIYRTKKKAAERDFEKMADFLKNEICRSVFLLNYFGEQNADNCNQCNVCLGIEFQSPPKDLAHKIEEVIQDKLLNSNSLKISEIISQFTESTPALITQTIKWLSEQNNFNISKSGRVVTRDGQK